MSRIIPFVISKDNTNFKIFDSLLPIHPLYLVMVSILSFLSFSLMLYILIAFTLETELRTDKREARAKEFICTV